MSNHPDDDATRETIVTRDFHHADPSEEVTQQHQTVPPEPKTS